jgi:RecB family endonuclease NucS
MFGLMTEHKRMLWYLQQMPRLLAEGLGIEQIWVRGIEYRLKTGDRVDLVAQDHTIIQVGPDTTCYVVELKSDKGDHEILGQLKKAVVYLQRTGEAIGHWKHTVGVAIAKEYTESGLKLLLDAEMIPLLWMEDERTKEIRLRKAYP